MSIEGIEAGKTIKPFFQFKTPLTPIHFFFFRFSRVMQKFIIPVFLLGAFSAATFEPKTRELPQNIHAEIDNFNNFDDLSLEDILDIVESTSQETLQFDDFDLVPTNFKITEEDPDIAEEFDNEFFKALMKDPADPSLTQSEMKDPEDPSLTQMRKKKSPESNSCKHKRKRTDDGVIYCECIETLFGNTPKTVQELWHRWFHSNGDHSLIGSVRIHSSCKYSYNIWSKWNKIIKFINHLMTSQGLSENDAVEIVKAKRGGRALSVFAKSVKLTDIGGKCPRTEILFGPGPTNVREVWNYWFHGIGEYPPTGSFELKPNECGPYTARVWRHKIVKYIRSLMNTKGLSEDEAINYVENERGETSISIFGRKLRVK